MQIRKPIHTVKGVHAIDGAGVHLTRVLGGNTVDKYDPFLMLDSFDTTDPKDYERGFPTHPHRGIETVTFLSADSMTHEDHLGTKATVTSGEAQWLTAGSGAYHSEMPFSDGRLLGLQLWLNMPAKDKLTAAPTYHGITNDEIQEFELEGGKLRLLTGTYKGHQGYQGKYLPLDYYDIHLDAHAKVELDVPENRSAMVFTLVGDAIVSGEPIAAKTAVKLGEGDTVVLEAQDSPIEIMFMSSIRLDEPVAWGGPVVMNTREEVMEAFREMKDGTFIKSEASYEDE